ncbi:hypothetical protein NHX12_017931 [Muraenolepis orangiensis]|uniref:Uncharacterized protein n=1 Tax=Muraenolepis orangiensis TaxID=630683 RepID=A0A9Q0F0B4_9TELE|nr:hypothetical protein NHX12_017931 [Muraenolepis orangiensis]
MYGSQHYHHKIQRECRNFIRANRCIFEPVILCCNHNNHYDIVYPQHYPKENWDQWSGGHAKDKTRASEDCESRPAQQEGWVSPPAGPAGRLPYEVLKSPDAELYRNLEFDAWHDTCKANLKPIKPVPARTVLPTRKGQLGFQPRAPSDFKPRAPLTYAPRTAGLPRYGAPRSSPDDEWQTARPPMVALPPSLYWAHLGPLPYPPALWVHHGTSSEDNPESGFQSPGVYTGTESMVNPWQTAVARSPMVALPPPLYWAHLLPLPYSPALWEHHGTSSEDAQAEANPTSTLTPAAQDCLHKWQMARPPMVALPPSPSWDHLGPLPYSPALWKHHGVSSEEIQGEANPTSTLTPTAQESGFQSPGVYTGTESAVNMWQTARPPMVALPSSPSWAHLGSLPYSPSLWEYHGTSSEDDQGEANPTSTLTPAAQESGFQSPGVYTGTGSTVNMWQTTLPSSLPHSSPSWAHLGPLPYSPALWEHHGTSSENDQGEANSTLTSAAQGE